MSEQDFTKPGLQTTPGTSPAPKSSGLKTFIVFTVIILVLAGLGWLIHYRLANATTKPGGGAGRGGAGGSGGGLWPARGDQGRVCAHGAGGSRDG